MSNLPIIKNRKRKSPLRVGVHLCRLAIFVAILAMIRWGRPTESQTAEKLESHPVAIQFLEDWKPGSTIEPWSEAKQAWPISVGGKADGLLIQTSPRSDSIVGYSGSSNVLVLIDQSQAIQGVQILSSGDTIDHVRAVREDDAFLDSFVGLKKGSDFSQIDAVSGATLTSHAIVASVAGRIDGSNLSLKFEATPRIENVKKLFPEATRLEVSRPSIFLVHGPAGQQLGSLLTTTPTADDLSGYQGPTAVMLGFVDGKCVGVVVDQTYENQPYASYLDDDAPFQKLYRGKTLLEVAAMTTGDAGIDGVSGATMTSQCVAEGITLTAQQVNNPKPGIVIRKASSWWIDAVTIVLTVVGLMISLGWIRPRKFRWVYLLAVIVFLGFVGGQMLSQALFVGWAMSSVPWQVAPGLVFLAAVALITPAVSKHQPYCHQVCPFGAMQQLARNRIGKETGLAKRLRSLLVRFGRWVPFVLLLVIVWAASMRVDFNLASIEPFDAFSFRVAGWATIGVFAAGMIVSLFVPMAYCRHGCPTGSVLDWLKFRGDSERLGVADAAALVLLLLAAIFNFMPST